MKRGVYCKFYGSCLQGHAGNYRNYAVIVAAGYTLDNHDWSLTAVESLGSQTRNDGISCDRELL